MDPDTGIEFKVFGYTTIKTDPFDRILFIQQTTGVTHEIKALLIENFPGQLRVMPVPRCDIGSFDPQFHFVVIGHHFDHTTRCRQTDYAGSFRDNVFRGNTIFDCDAGIAISQPNPKYKGPSANTLIENNDISGCVEWGILLDGARTVMIRNNRIVGSRFVGIELRKSRSGYASTHNTIEGNFLRDNAVCGLLISEGNDYNKIVRNRLTDNFKGEIRVVRSSHTLIVDNLIHETMNYNKYWNDSTNGIALKGGEDNRVHNNTYYWQQD